jgi:serine/threonine protein kinase
LADIPTADWSWIDAVAERFEHAWKNGERPRIEEFLIKVPEPQWPPLLQELVRVEGELRRRAGEEPCAEEYRQRFPEHEGVISAVFESALAASTLADQAEAQMGTGPHSPDPCAATNQGVSSTAPYMTDDPDDASVWLGDATRAPLRTKMSTCLTAEQRYRLIRPLAEGGLGQVLLARDEVLGRDVALKHIRPHLGEDANMRDRFLVEAQITGNLEHPGIVGVYAIGHDPDGRPFYVMRLIRGESLCEAIRRYHESEGSRRDAGARTLALRKLINRLIDACNAVAFAHSRGVLHRDIKPANIMIGKYGETLVVDWGLATRLYKSRHFVAGVALTQSSPTRDQEDAAAETRSGETLGTPGYMSPEQAEGRQDLMEPTSDVYSLGCTLYHILTGRAPLEGNGILEVFAATCKGDFPSPRAVHPSVDPALEAICLKAMAHDPDYRYATARALADDLERWLADEPMSAYRDPPPRALSRWLARHPRVLIRGLVVVVALLGLALSGIVLTLTLRGVGSR